MVTADSAQAFTGQGPDNDPISLPVPPPATAPRWQDSAASGSLAFVVAAFCLLLVLAFLLGSSPVRQSDFWLRLASGKLIAEGKFGVASDAFSYAAAPSPWVNHSWLYELVLYGLFQLLGSTGLAILKALVVSALAGVLVLAGRRGKGWTASLAATALALIALAPWLTLRPALLSYVLLALTFWILERQTEQEHKTFSAFLKAYWPILILFALWVNVDSWFFLGPLLVCLYLLGVLLPRPRTVVQGHETTAPRGGTARVLAILLLLGLGACLFNPYFARAFEIMEPLGLSDSAARLREDSQLRRQLLAPHEDVYSPRRFFATGPGLAFWFLGVFSLASFALCWQNRPWQRLFTWLSLLLLCLLTRWAVPFFCIVAAPMLALNLADFRIRRMSIVREAPSPWDRLARAIVFLALLFLCPFAWAGRVQNHSGPRRWTIEMEPSLAEAGKQIAQWRTAGSLGTGDRGLHLAPEAANIFAWYCPQERSLLNAHRHVPAEAAADYIALRNGLLGQESDWRSLLRRWHIRYVVMYNNEQRITERGIHVLLAKPEEWSLLYQRGRVAIFAWRDPEAPDSASLPDIKPLRLAERAFSLKSEDVALVPERNRKGEPSNRPFGDPSPYRWLDAWWRSVPERLLDADEARQEVTLFQASLPVQFQEIKKAWVPWQSARAMGVVGMGGSPLAGWPRGVADVFGGEFLYPVSIQEQLFFSARDLGSPAPLYLAIRAARRALQAHPDSAVAYWALGDAYFALAKLTRERSYHFPLLVQMRTIQAVAAYQQALALRPGLQDARRNLIDLYQKMGYMDVVLEQLQTLLKGRQMMAASSDAAQQGAAQLAKNVQKFAAQIAQLEEKFMLGDVNLRVVERARLAVRLGLPATALKILLASDVAAFGAPGLDLELRLLLETGRLQEVRTWLEPSHENLLGTSLYYHLRAKLAAAEGDYEGGDRDLGATVLKLTELAKEPLSLQDGAAFMVGSAVLSGATGGPFGKFTSELLRVAPLKKRATLLPDYLNAPRYCWELNFKLAEEAKINILRGLLAVEAGNMVRARRLFDSALRFWQSQGGMVFTDPESHSARLIAQQWLKQIDEATRKP